MKKDISNKIILLSLAVAFLAIAADSQAGSRGEIIAKELDCVSNHSVEKKIGWDDVCYTSDRIFPRYGEKREDIVAKTLDRLERRSVSSSDINTKSTTKSNRDEVVQSFSELPTHSKPAKAVYKEIPQKNVKQQSGGKSTFEFGAEISNIRYAEPDVMKQKGNMYGVYGVYTYRRPLGIKNDAVEDDILDEASEIFLIRDIFNVVKADVKYSTGLMDYESEGTGSNNNDRDHMIETRGVVGRDFYHPKLPIRTMPYGGIGYRYLYDDGRGVTTTGHYGYRRRANYFYAPFGVETVFSLPQSWEFGFTMEYDLFIHGIQKSHLEDVRSSYSTLTNAQTGGYGLRGSMKLAKKTEFFDFHLEPFIRYWSIENSRSDILYDGGTPLWYMYEPLNNSSEYGVKFAVQF